MHSSGTHFIDEAVWLISQLAVILVAAKIGAEVCERFFKQPPVLGELIAGVLLGPFLIGGHIPFPGHAALFPLPVSATDIPFSISLFSIAQIAVVLLLFVTGLETNVKRFLHYAGPAFVIALGGVLLPFFTGAWLAVYFGVADHLSAIPALFVGAILTATSVGMTARMLGDMGRLDSPEGVTILAGAVVDDVLGILVLSIVVAMAAATTTGAIFSWGPVGLIALKAIGFWMGFTALGLLLAESLERIFIWFRTSGAVLPLALALCFIAAAAAEMMGLAMIIGAYALGLALSSRPVARDLIKAIEPVSHFLVPIFFVVTGMMVNLAAVRAVWVFGAVLSLVAIVTKLVGCAFPALGFGFTGRGAYRIGVGMIPRGEVALIIAQIGIAKGIITSGVYGVAIMVTLVTTLVAPPWLQSAFRTGGAGVWQRRRAIV